MAGALEPKGHGKHQHERMWGGVTGQSPRPGARKLPAAHKMACTNTHSSITARRERGRRRDRVKFSKNVGPTRPRHRWTHSGEYAKRGPERGRGYIGAKHIIYLKDCIAKKKSLFDSVGSSEVEWNSHQTVIYSSVPTTGASAAGAGFSLTAVAAGADGLAPTR